MPPDFLFPIRTGANKHHSSCTEYVCTRGNPPDHHRRAVASIADDGRNPERQSRIGAQKTKEDCDQQPHFGARKYGAPVASAMAEFLAVLLKRFANELLFGLIEPGGLVRR